MVGAGRWAVSSWELAEENEGVGALSTNLSGSRCVILDAEPATTFLVQVRPAGGGSSSRSACRGKLSRHARQQTVLILI